MKTFTLIFTFFLGDGTSTQSTQLISLEPEDGCSAEFWASDYARGLTHTMQNIINANNWPVKLVSVTYADTEKVKELK